MARRVWSPSPREGAQGAEGALKLHVRADPLPCPRLTLPTACSRSSQTRALLLALQTLCCCMCRRQSPWDKSRPSKTSHSWEGWRGQDTPSIPSVCLAASPWPGTHTRTPRERDKQLLNWSPVQSRCVPSLGRRGGPALSPVRSISGGVWEHLLIPLPLLSHSKSIPAKGSAALTRPLR